MQRPTLFFSWNLSTKQLLSIIVLVIFVRMYSNLSTNFTVWLVTRQQYGMRPRTNNINTLKSKRLQTNRVTNTVRPSFLSLTETKVKWVQQISRASNFKIRCLITFRWYLQFSQARNVRNHNCQDRLPTTRNQEAVGWDTHKSYDKQYQCLSLLYLYKFWIDFMNDPRE